MQSKVVHNDKLVTLPRRPAPDWRQDHQEGVVNGTVSVPTPSICQEPPQWKRAFAAPSLLSHTLVYQFLGYRVWCCQCDSWPTARGKPVWGLASLEVYSFRIGNLGRSPPCSRVAKVSMGFWAYGESPKITDVIPSRTAAVSILPQLSAN